MKILIVEDDITQATYYQTVLTDYDIDVTVNGDDFIMKYDDSYSLLIIDLMLPKLSGYDLLNFLDSINSTVPVVVISAQDFDRSKLININQTVTVIRKPIMSKSLLTIVNETINTSKTCAK